MVQVSGLAEVAQMPDTTLGSAHRSKHPHDHPRASPSPPCSSMSCFQQQHEGRQGGLQEPRVCCMQVSQPPAPGPPPLHF